MVVGTSSTGVDDEGLPGDGSAGDDGGAGVTLVPAESMWRVSASPGAGWTAAAFDDSSWTELAAPLGRGYDDVTPWMEDGPVFGRHVFSEPFPARRTARAARAPG